MVKIPHYFYMPHIFIGPKLWKIVSKHCPRCPNYAVEVTENVAWDFCPLKVLLMQTKSRQILPPWLQPDFWLLILEFHSSVSPCASLAEEYFSLHWGQPAHLASIAPGKASALSVSLNLTQCQSQADLWLQNLLKDQSEFWRMKSCKEIILLIEFWTEFKCLPVYLTAAFVEVSVIVTPLCHLVKYDFLWWHGHYWGRRTPSNFSNLFHILVTSVALLMFSNFLYECTLLPKSFSRLSSSGIQTWIQGWVGNFFCFAVKSCTALKMNLIWFQHLHTWAL